MHMNPDWLRAQWMGGHWNQREGHRAFSIWGHLPPGGVVHHGHHFGRGLFIYLLAERTCLHIAVGLNNVHGPVAANWEKVEVRSPIRFWMTTWPQAWLLLTWNDNCRRHCPWGHASGADPWTRPGSRSARRRAVFAATWYVSQPGGGS